MQSETGKIEHFEKPEKAKALGFDINILPEEAMILERLPEKDRLTKLINMRFDIWLKYNNLKPSTLIKIKMRQAFLAGWHAKDIK